METSYYTIPDTTTVPPGWSYNPSTWRERIPLVVIAIVGLLIALYLSAYQLRILDTIWDPFFGSASSELILDSPISNILPIPDALLGAFGYLLDAVTGVIGGTRRWKTKPWIVFCLVLPLGRYASQDLFLVIAQPVFFNAWCTLCLTSAFISTVMIGPAMDEVLASLQYMQRVKRSGHSTWKAFWGDKSIRSTVI